MDKPSYKVKPYCVECLKEADETHNGLCLDCENKLFRKSAPAVHK